MTSVVDDGARNPSRTSLVVERGVGNLESANRCQKGAEWSDSTAIQLLRIWRQRSVSRCAGRSSAGTVNIIVPKDRQRSTEPSKVHKRGPRDQRHPIRRALTCFEFPEWCTLSIVSNTSSNES